MTDTARNLLYGAGSLFNIFGTPVFGTGVSRSDAEAMQADWQHVGADIRKAIQRYEAS